VRPHQSITRAKTGNIGQIAAKILNGFSPGKLLGYDPYPNEVRAAANMAPIRQ